MNGANYRGTKANAAALRKGMSTNVTKMNTAIKKVTTAAGRRGAELARAKIDISKMLKELIAAKNTWGKERMEQAAVNGAKSPKAILFISKLLSVADDVNCMAQNISEICTNITSTLQDYKGKKAEMLAAQRMAGMAAAQMAAAAPKSFLSRQSLIDREGEDEILRDTDPRITVDWDAYEFHGASGDWDEEDDEYRSGNEGDDDDKDYLTHGAPKKFDPKVLAPPPKDAKSADHVAGVFSASMTKKLVRVRKVVTKHGYTQVSDKDRQLIVDCHRRLKSAIEEYVKLMEDSIAKLEDHRVEMTKFSQDCDALVRDTLPSISPKFCPRVEGAGKN